MFFDRTHVPILEMVFVRCDAVHVTGCHAESIVQDATAFACDTGETAVALLATVVPVGAIAQV